MTRHRDEDSLPLSKGGRRLVPAHLAYNAGRVVVYMLLGAIAGALGSTAGMLGRLAGVCLSHRPLCADDPAGQAPGTPGQRVRQRHVRAGDDTGDRLPDHVECFGSVHVHSCSGFCRNRVTAVR